MNNKNTLDMINLVSLLMLSNGFIVIVMKLIEAHVNYYYISVYPILIWLLFFSPWRVNKESLRIYFSGFLISAFVLIILEDSFGSDAALYFSHPINDFFVDKRFGFTEKPYISFGDQPIATYWLNANFEYLVVSIVKLSGLPHSYSSNFHFLVTSGCLLSIIIAISKDFYSREKYFIYALLYIAVSFFIYTDGKDIVGMSFFRAFESKSWIFGFYIISSWVLFYQCRGGQYIGRSTLLLTSSFFVSANFLILIPLLLFLVTIKSILDEKKQLGILFIIYCFFLVTVNGILNSVDVYREIVLQEGKSNHVYDFFGIKEIILWLIILLFSIVNFFYSSSRLWICLLLYFFVGIFIRFPFVVDMFYVFFPEKTMVYWRIALAFNEYPGLILIVHTIIKCKAISFRYYFVLTAFLWLILPFNLKNPYYFNLNKWRDNYDSLFTDDFVGEYLILAGDDVSPFFGYLYPENQYLYSKRYFLYWQIKNLQILGENDNEAVNAVRAGMYLSGLEADVKFLYGAIEGSRPDVVFIKREIIQKKRSIVRELLRYGYSFKKYKAHYIFFKEDVVNG